MSTPKRSVSKRRAPKAIVRSKATGVRKLVGEFRSALDQKMAQDDQSLRGITVKQRTVITNKASEAFEGVAVKVRHNHRLQDEDHKAGIEDRSDPSFVGIAVEMEQSLSSLGPALAKIPTSVSPQLARASAATEQAWRELESEFGLLTSTEVSDLVGSDSPNRSYASNQRSQGKLIAVKRPKGLRYPGYQFDRSEHAILPVIEELIALAQAAGRSESSLALWIIRPTGYLDGDRPVDRFSDPERVLEVAKPAFDVQW
ncbi:hypothetical protein [Glutamicibacter sp. M10]|uniref:hypothetical protein n=1 Tax=Glutamicibacter sp. M10 TaxID=3023076 RepID=UPI0021C647A4|nr:hypothetical protein [Glutamicibacter sp. M10]UXN32779.1 hypothetical protein N6V40_04835 [Glutamicibacter sp. M10]